MIPVNSDLTLEKSKQLYRMVLADNDKKAQRELCQRDLFYLLYIGLKRRDVDDHWIYDRCREVESEPDGFLDLWAREHYKSTIITFAKTIQDILCDPEITIGIFSHTRPIAKAFLKQIKTEFENNEYLKALFPEILYQNPEKESPCWSMDNGIRVKRTTNPKENTVEAWGLIDGQPTSKHFRLLIYDDTVTRESVYTADQIKNTTNAWELSLNLGARGGKRRIIGTRYHYNDTYRVMIERGSVKVRIHAATKDGTAEGEPVLLTKEELRQKRIDMGIYTFGCQMLQNPTADSAMGFMEIWLNYYEKIKDRRLLNVYIIVDPAGEKKKENDYTVMLVIGLASDGNYYLIDGLRDRLNLPERIDALFRLVRKHRPIAVGYEKYGMQCDIEAIKMEMEHKNYRFRLIPVGGSLPKPDRIRKLVPIFERGRMILPYRLLFSDYEDKLHDLVREFKDDEYMPFPGPVHDDILDCMARIVDEDLGAEFPEFDDDDNKQTPPKPYDPLAA